MSLGLEIHEKRFMAKAKYLSLLALSALLVGCGPTSNPTSEPSVDPSVDPSTEPSVDPFVAPESIGLIGSFAESNWSTDIEFTSDDEGHNWVLESYPLYEGDMWKIRKDHSWGTVGTDNWGATYLDETSYALFEDVTSDNNNIKVLTSGYYTISFDYDNLVISAELVEEMAPELADVVAKAVAAYDSVNGGSVNYRNSWTEEPEWSYQYIYTLGNDANGPFIYLQEANKWNSDGYIDEVFGYTSSGGMYGITIEEDGSYSRSYTSATPDSLYGPALDLFSYSFTLNGAQGILNKVAEMYAAYPASAYVYADGVHMVMTQYVVVNEYYSDYNSLFDITLQFTTHENGAIESMYFTYDVYNNLVEDLELGWVLSEESTCTGTEVVECTQTVDARTIENPLGNIDSLFFSSWDVVDGSGNVVTSIETGAGSNVELFIGNKLPETASTSIDTIDCEVVEGDADSINAYYNSWYGSMNVSSSVEGTYKLRVFSANVERFVTVTITAAHADRVYAWFATSTGSDYYDTETEVSTETPYSLYVGSTVYILPRIEPNEADQEVSIKVSGDAITTTDNYSFQMSSYADPTYALEVVGAKAGTATITITAVKAPEITVTYTIEVKEAPTLADLVSHTWVDGYNGRANAEVSFAPSANPASGQVTIVVAKDAGYETNTYDYAYDAATKEFVLSKDGTVASCETLVLKFTDSYNLFVKVGEWSEFTLSIKSPYFDLEGSWEAYQILDQESNGLSNSFINISFDENATKFDFLFQTITTNWETGVMVEALDLDLTLESISDTTYKAVFDTSVFDGTDISNINITVAKDFSVVSVSFTSATYGAISQDITR